MNVVDSSGWLEYFSDGPNAEFFASSIQNFSELIVPTLSIYEVFKRILQLTDEDDALQAVALMHQGQIIDLDPTIALRAAKISVDLKLPMADSVILATARTYKAILWTQDSHFENIEDVQYIAKM
jgi:predicted nucleic acid-binding protein